MLNDLCPSPLAGEEKNPCGLLDQPDAADSYRDQADHEDSGVLQGARSKQHSLERRLKQPLEHAHAAAEARSRLQWIIGEPGRRLSTPLPSTAL